MSKVLRSLRIDRLGAWLLLALLMMLLMLMFLSYENGNENVIVADRILLPPPGATLISHSLSSFLQGGIQTTLFTKDESN
jgi:hypothetical protein